MKGVDVEGVEMEGVDVEGVGVVLLSAPHHFLDGDVAVREGPVPLLVQAVVPVTVQDQLQELHPEQVSSYQCFGSIFIESESGSGSRGPLNPDRIWIRIRNTASYIPV